MLDPTATMRTFAQMDDAMNELRAANAQLQRERARYSELIKQAEALELKALRERDSWEKACKNESNANAKLVTDYSATVKQLRDELKEAREQLRQTLGAKPTLDERLNNQAKSIRVYQQEIETLRADLAAARAKLAECERDAMRYRWLRKQQWDTSNLFVVTGGKDRVKLGTDCPSLDRLDAAIDAAIATEDKP